MTDIVRPLTPKQAQILRLIMQTLEARGHTPTIREIGKTLEIGSLRGVTNHLDALQAKGYIDRDARAHAIRVLRDTTGANVRLTFERLEDKL